jgi:antitoxin (DNA-binding transcriptional repressor) of toxin-antitoxin stability system
VIVTRGGRAVAELYPVTPPQGTTRSDESRKAAAVETNSVEDVMVSAAVWALD